MLNLNRGGGGGGGGAQQQQSQLQIGGQQGGMRSEINLGSHLPADQQNNAGNNNVDPMAGGVNGGVNDQSGVNKQKKIPVIGSLSSNMHAENQIQLTQLVRSDYYSQIDRQADYEAMTSEIRKMGIFGLGRINMEEYDDQIIVKKAQLEGRGETEQKAIKEELLNRNRPKSEMDDLMAKDGLFVTNESQLLLNLEEQLQKQRMMNNDRFLLKFFKKNGDLVTDSQFFDEKISKVRIVSTVPNQALALRRRPAVNCERLNQNKHDPYKLRVFIGKIVLSKHYKMIQEELNIQDLLVKVSEFKERSNLAYIPHYDKALKIIEQEISYLERATQRQPKKQIAILENERNKLQKLVSEEANLLRNLIYEILDKWKAIQDIRSAQGKNHSPYKLYAKQYRNQDNGMELEFLVVKDTYVDDKEADRTEARRRNAIRADKIYVELIVNGQLVGKSGICQIEWPSFEVKIMEQFHILLFTRPKSMQLRICSSGLIDSVIDYIDLEIPGDKSRAITSTSQLLNEVEFCQGASARKAQKLHEIEVEKQKLIEKAKQEQIQKENERKQQLLEQAQAKKRNAGKKDEEQKQQQDEVVSVNKEGDNGDGQVINSGNMSPRLLEERQKEEEKRMIQVKMDQLQLQEKKARENASFRGRVSVLCEWTGTGDKMPPQNIDNFGKTQATGDDLMSAFKDPDDEVNQIIEDTTDDGFHFDVNDPRNELELEKLRHLRYKDQRAKVLRDIYLPFAHIESLRERLIKCSQINPEITYIPIEEDEIYQNQRLMELIEKTEKGIFLLEELGDETAVPEKRTMFLGDVAITAKEVFDNQSYETRKRIENIKRVLLKRQKFAMIRKQNNRDGAPLTLKNVVNEYIIGENEILIFELIKQCFTQQRKLQPKKKKEEKIRLQDIKSGISFLFHISHGTNVPLRDDLSIRKQQQQMIELRQRAIMAPFGMQPGMGMGFGMQNMGGSMGMMDQPKMHDGQNESRRPLVEFKNIQDLVRVNSYVQIKLIFEKQEYFVDSKPFEGNNPEWSSDRPIFLPQLLNKKLSNYELFNSSNQIVVSLFDLKQIRKQSKMNKKKYHTTQHSFFLGNIQIPLYSLFLNQKMAATFRLNRPLIIIGYYTDNTSILGFNDMNLQNSKIRIDPLVPTTISLSINIDPFIEIQQDSDDIFYGDGVDSRIEYQANKWLEKFKKHKVIGQRHIRVWGNDIEQNSFYLPRYLRRLKPPAIFMGGDFSDPKDIKKDLHAIEKVARFVSLIPFKNDTELFKDIPDIHCDSQQFLDLKGGDFEEHAFLLCNYFNYIDFYSGRNYKSYVLLGHAIPEGKTFYVLRRDLASNKIEVWNPSTGEPFVMTTEVMGTQFLCCTIGKNKQSVINRYDKACPLYDVGCIIDEKNVYVNIQSSGAPSQIDWNVENKKSWEPFLNDIQIDTIFGEQGIESVYKTEDDLKYEVTPLQPIKQLKQTIFSYLERRISDSRQKEVNIQPESTKFSSDRNKEELFQSLESMKYKCRLSALGTELSNEDQVNPMANDPSGAQGNQMNNNGNGLGGARNNQSGGPNGTGSMFNNNTLDNEFVRKYRSAIETLESIQSQIEEYVPPNKQLYGFPINMAFTSIEKIWDEIKQTGIHEILQSDIEYILDVHCYPYPNFIISVWVFVGVFYEE